MWVDAFKAARGEHALDSAAALAAERIVACDGDWRPLWLLARVELERERVNEADAGFSMALKAAEASGDPVGVARSADQLGWIRFVGRSFDEGRRLFEEAIGAAVLAERRDLEGFARNNLAGLLVEEGNYSLASHQLEAASRALERAGRPDAAVGLAYNRAALLLELGDAVAARRTLQSVFEQAEAVGDLWTQQASAVVLGNLHLALREPAAAQAWYERVGPEVETLELLAQLGMGRVAIADGSFEEAVAALTPVAELSGAEQTLFAGMASIFLADAELRLGRIEQAEARLEPWRVADEAAVPAEVLWGARWMLGRVRLVQGRHREAATELQAAVEGLEATGADLDPLIEGLRFLRQRREPYVDLAVAQSRLLRTGEIVADEVLQTVSGAQARGLQRSLRNSDATETAKLDRIQAGLRQGELMLDYLIGEDRGVLIAIGTQSLELFEIDGLRTLAQPLADLRRRLTQPSGDPTAGVDERTQTAVALLQDKLIEPAANSVRNARRLYVVPDGPLATLPFELLLDPAQEIAWLPVAGVPGRGTRPATPLLLAGSPTFATGTAFEPLPWSAFELSKLQELWGPSKVTLLVGDELKLDRLARLDTSSFGTLHFATHAVASTVDPRQCGVVLSGAELLGIDRIVDLDLQGSLVVLSACRTGEGELIPGEGIVGLGWAFLRGGASGVVTSLWSVDDAVSARMMVEFHRRLAAGDDPVAALAAARRETAVRRPDPSHWAPFVIVLRPEID